MNDIELLEMAAKAAGIDGYYAEFKHNDYRGIQISSDIEADLWNPLTDDGDALRLAVKLGLEIVPMHNCQVDAVLYMDGAEIVHVAESMREDKFFATRRAIVRAAAEIVKAMP